MEHKEITIEGKVVKIKKAPATVAYDIALKYGKAVSGGSLDPEGMQDCLYALLKYAEIVLPDGRSAALNNKEIINQHFSTPKSLMELQKATIAMNFDFLASGAASNS